MDWSLSFLELLKHIAFRFRHIISEKSAKTRSEETQTYITFTVAKERRGIHHPQRSNKSTVRQWKVLMLEMQHTKKLVWEKWSLLYVIDKPFFMPGCVCFMSQLPTGNTSTLYSSNWTICHHPFHFSVIPKQILTERESGTNHDLVNLISELQYWTQILQRKALRRGGTTVEKIKASQKTLT